MVFTFKKLTTRLIWKLNIKISLTPLYSAGFSQFESMGLECFLREAMLVKSKKLHGYKSTVDRQIILLHCQAKAKTDFCDYCKFPYSANSLINILLYDRTICKLAWDLRKLTYTWSNLPALYFPLHFKRLHK